jgi:hypothetical protein
VFLLASAIALTLWVETTAAADPVSNIGGSDKVLIQRTGQAGRITLNGTIQDYTGRGLILQTRGGTGVSRFNRDEVLEVITNYSEKHLAARKLFAEGKIAEADAAFQEALDDENRTWVRREILASQVKCALWRGGLSRAALRFLPIVESDPDTIYFGLIPLVWQEQTPASASAAEAQRWLKSDSPAAQLIGASWLYQSNRAVALKILQSLSSAAQQNVQRYAQIQLWRARLNANDLGGPEIRRWATLVDELPADLRAGPMFLIGRAHQQQHDDLNAAAAWLWLPFEFPEHRHLAAEAEFCAAEALLRAGDKSAARQQAQELLLRFGDAPAAVLAKELQQRIDTEPR